MRRLRLLVLLALTVVTSGGCAGTSPLEPIDPALRSGETVQTLYVAPYTVTCTGEGVFQCMLVKERPQDSWQRFYGDIEDFHYQLGFNYQLRIAWREVPNPPADGSSRASRLLEIVAKTPA